MSKDKLRACCVGEVPGYFHCWEQTKDAGVKAIVEFADRVRRIDPEKLEFVDEENNWLYTMMRHTDEKTLEIIADKLSGPIKQRMNIDEYIEERLKEL